MCYSENWSLFTHRKTSKQRTWIVATNKRLYLILDDVRKEYVKVNKSYRINSIYNQGKLNVRITPDYKPLTGLIYFLDATRGWLYSKELFPHPNDLSMTIIKVIESLI